MTYQGGEDKKLFLPLTVTLVTAAESVAAAPGTLALSDDTIGPFFDVKPMDLRATGEGVSKGKLDLECHVLILQTSTAMSPTTTSLTTTSRLRSDAISIQGPSASLLHVMRAFVLPPISVGWRQPTGWGGN